MIKIARKRKWRETSAIRYRAKMYRYLGHGLPEHLAMELTDAVFSAHSAGFEMYKQIREKVTSDPRWGQIPAVLRGLYLAFVNELVHKVFVRGIAKPEEIINKWERIGLEREKLLLVYDIAFGAFHPKTKPNQQ